MTNNSFLLVAFHNQKSLGVRCLEKALNLAGFNVYIVFFKGFNSIKPANVTETELELLVNVIEKTRPSVIGLSVMTSLYLDTVFAVNKKIKNKFNIPIVWGGVYASLFPKKCLKHADFVICGEAEQSIIELADAIINKKSIVNINNVAWLKEGRTVLNEIRAPVQNLDKYGRPEIGGENKYFIESNRLLNKDPQLYSYSYELSASRGCPFTCSFCSSVNLKRLYKGKGKYIRFRSVSSIINELKEAKNKLKRLKFIHFWDEIFPSDIKWIDNFSTRYMNEINLPFEIWIHPLTVNKNLIKKLKYAGLYKAVMGIQSGSEYIRKNVFHRSETQLDIINASKILKESNVPQVIYDFILQHPFESIEDIRKSFNLSMKLALPFELQLHALNYFPGTDICNMVVNKGIMSKSQLEDIMYSPMKEQYKKYWQLNNHSAESNFWYSLIVMSQFGIARPIARFLSKNHNLSLPVSRISKIFKPFTHIRHYYKKGKLILKAIQF